jgi:hypothetical protein
MPQAAIGLADPTFGTPLVPRNASDALLLFLFPYPNTFQPTTTGVDPIATLGAKTIGQLVRLCNEYGGKFKECATDGQVMGVESEFKDALLTPLGLGSDTFFSLDESSEPFYRWTIVQAFARTIKSFELIATDDERRVGTDFYPEEPLLERALNNFFPGAKEFNAITERELETLSGSDKDPLVLQSFSKNVLGQDASISYRTFKERVKALGKIRLINLLAQSVVDDHYGTDLQNLNTQSRLFLFFWKKNLLTIQSGDRRPLMEFYGSYLKADPIPFALTDTSPTLLAFKDIERDPTRFFTLSLDAREKIIKESLGGFSAIPMSIATVANKTFANCVETALFNFTMALIHKVEGGKVILDPSILPTCPLKSYLEANPGTLEDYSKKHSEWATIIAGITGVSYCKKTETGRGCEVDPGLISTLNILSFLLNVGDPLDHREGAPIDTRLEEISTFIRRIGNLVTLRFAEDSDCRWYAPRHDYMTMLYLVYGDDRGTLSISQSHTEFEWISATSQRVIPIFEAANTQEELLVAAPLVTHPESFQAYFEKLKALDGLDDLRRHLFQMRLSSLALQKAIFGNIYDLPGFQPLALSIAKQASGSAYGLLQGLTFMWTDRPVPSDDFLSSLAKVCPGLVQGNSFTVDGGPYVSFMMWCLSNGKDAIIEDNLYSFHDFEAHLLPESHKAPTTILSYLRRIPNITSLGLHSMKGSFDEQRPLFDFLLSSTNNLGILENVCIPYDYAIGILDKSPRLHTLRFSLLEDGGWTKETLRIFVDAFLIPNPEFNLVND